MPDPLVAAASLHRQRGDRFGAEMRYLSALRGGALAPSDELTTLVNLSVIYSERENLPMAEMCARRALAVSPQDAATQSNLGNYLFRQGDVDGGIALLRRAVEVAPEDGNGISPHANLALALYDMADYEGAIGEMEKAISLCGAPEAMMAAQLSFDLGRAVLATGDYDRGWMLYEQRWGRLVRTHIWDLGIPEWDGNPATLEGKSILVHQDQGFGDTLQFVRLVPRLFEMGAKPVIATPRPLVRLLSEIAPSIDIADVATSRLYDFHISVCSLPYRLGLTLETLLAKPYLGRSALATERRVKQNFNVMLFWAADTSRGSGSSRSVPLERLLSLAAIPGVRLYSAQMPPHAADIARVGAAAFVEDLAPRIRDFADTAAFMANMDLVICVDTAPLHLAGAMGVPCIALLPSLGRCWRWGSGDHETPWYPSMRLIWAQPERFGAWPWDDLYQAVRAQAEQRVFWASGERQAAD